MLPPPSSMESWQPVQHGPRAYRSRLRSFGPVVGLLPAGVLGGLAALLARGDRSTFTGVLGFGLAVLAAPLMLVAGVPLADGDAPRWAGIAASAVLWFALGVLAARRATRRPVATWGDFWREWVWLAAGVWLGAIAALVAVDLVLGRALF